MTANDIRHAIETTRTGTEADRVTADRVVAAARALTRPALFEALSAAGLEGVRRGDGKADMLDRLHRRLTAVVRARERAEC